MRVTAVTTAGVASGKVERAPVLADWVAEGKVVARVVGFLPEISTRQAEVASARHITIVFKGLLIVVDKMRESC